MGAALSANDQLLSFERDVRTVCLWSEGGWRAIAEWPHSDYVRELTGASFDPARNVVIVVTGNEPGVTSTWDGHNITILPPEANLEDDGAGNYFMLPDRSGHVIAFGPTRSFSWDGHRWSRLPASATLPTGVESIGADPIRQVVIAISSAGSFATWRWEGGTWQSLTPSISPPSDAAYSNLVFDPQLGGLVLTALPKAPTGCMLGCG